MNDEERERRSAGAIRKRVLFLILFFFSPSLALSLTPSDSVTVVCVGDVMMAHGMKSTLEKRGSDYPFEKVRPFLRNADIVFGNLENPIGSRGERFPDKEFYFRMDPPHAAALKRAGFRVMSLANNHILDYGPEAFEETLDELKAQGIAYCGAGHSLRTARRPARIAVGKETVAFLAYNRTFPVAFTAGDESPGTAWPEVPFLRQDIRLAKKDSDWVIVSFHWGKEYTRRPSRALRRLARAAVNAGADAVVGHHPHVIQGIERYKNRIIAYSLGNFAFGTRNKSARNGLLLRLFLKKTAPPRAEIIPLLVNNHQVRFQPEVLKGREAGSALQRLKKLSRKLGTRLRVAKDRAYLP